MTNLRLDVCTLRIPGGDTRWVPVLSSQGLDTLTNLKILDVSNNRLEELPPLAPFTQLQVTHGFLSPQPLSHLPSYNGAIASLFPAPCPGWSA